MAMFRRSSKSSPPLRRREEEIARQEADLRERLEKLEQLVAKVPQIEKNRAYQASSFDAQGAKRRPNHFSASSGGACGSRHLANQQLAFLNDSHGRGRRSRCCVRRQAGADQSVGSERFSEAIGRCAELHRKTSSG